MLALAPHHAAWLAAHPHRSESWLRDHLRDGFDVHHIDGDRTNNAPENLALIEHTDHMRLHGGFTLGRLTKNRATISKRKLRTTELTDGTVIKVFPNERIQAAIEITEYQRQIFGHVPSYRLAGQQRP